GGTVVADENGVLSCVRGNTGSCPNIQIGNTVQIRAFVGYDNNGAPVCKTVMTFDNAACNQYSNPNNSTSNSVMIGLTVNANGTTTPNCCVKGTGCPSANTVCANGYDGVMDKCGFLCPGTKPQSVDTSAQPLVY